MSADIHDDWFDPERLERVGQSELRLPIYACLWRKRWWGWTGSIPGDPPPAPSAVLVVRSVLEVSVEDDAQIGWCGVSHLAFEPSARELRLVSNIPCEVVVRVRELDVELIR
jgi:hypothetical protein